MPSTTSRGMPMSATTTSPQRSSAGGSMWATFGAAKVTVRSASMASPIRSAVSAESPLGTSTDTTRSSDPLRSRTIVSYNPSSGRLKPVPNSASTTSPHVAMSEKCRSHSCSSVTSTTVWPSRPRISRLTRASPRTSATRPTRKTEASPPPAAAYARRRSRPRRCCRFHRGRRRAAAADRRSAAGAWRPPAVPHIPSAPATGSRSPRSSPGRPLASVGR